MRFRKTSIGSTNVTKVLPAAFIGVINSLHEADISRPGISNRQSVVTRKSETSNVVAPKPTTNLTEMASHEYLILRGKS